MKIKVLAILLGLNMLNQSWSSQDNFMLFQFDPEDKFFPHKLNEELISREKFSFSSPEGEELYVNKYCLNNALSSINTRPFSKIGGNIDIVREEALHFYYQPKS